MKDISPLVEKVLDKLSDEEKGISLYAGLEFKLLFNIDLSKPFRKAKKEFMKQYITDILVLNFANITKAAQKARLNRRHLHRLIKKLDIDIDSLRQELFNPDYYIKKNIQSIIEENNTDSIEIVITNFSNKIEKITEKDITFEQIMSLFEREYLLKVYIQNNKNVAKTADAVKLSERTLYRKINNYELK
ncbi:hypothetical protein GF327_00810 [Candidatus Woesearchaeota archaeon]|nr:hypothetical protein [Candidatus Woesearchaeota archaeon]